MFLNPVIKLFNTSLNKNISNKGETPKLIITLSKNMIFVVLEFLKTSIVHDTENCLADYAEGQTDLL